MLHQYNLGGIKYYLLDQGMVLLNNVPCGRQRFLPRSENISPFFLFLLTLIDNLLAFSKAEMLWR